MDIHTEIDIKEEIDIYDENIESVFQEYDVKINVEELNVCDEGIIYQDDYDDDYTEVNYDWYCYQSLINPEKHKCYICKQIFFNRHDLYKHNVKHLEIKLDKNYRKITPLNPTILYVCTFCQKALPYRSWHSHMSNVHGQGDFKCEHCEKTFKCQRYLSKHISNHNRYKPTKGVYKCDICNTVYNTNDSLGQHYRNCHKLGMFYCDRCPSQFKTQSYLRTHLRRVHYNDGKTHYCDCGKGFKSPRYLSIHRKNANHRKN